MSYIQCVANTNQSISRVLIKTYYANMKIGATGVREMRSINYLMSRKLADYSHVPAKYPNIRRQSILYFNGYFAIYTSSY